MDRDLYQALNAPLKRLYKRMNVYLNISTVCKYQGITPTLACAYLSLLDLINFDKKHQICFNAVNRQC